MKVSATAKLLGVIGYPVEHSLSPLLHNRWIADAGLDALYMPLRVKPGDLASAVEGLKALGYLGANITIPHKEDALALCDRLDPSAKALGAVNTLHVQGERVTGYNTDAPGFVGHLANTVPDWKSRLGDRPVLILGAGGAARAVVYGLCEAGCGLIQIANRTHKTATRLAEDFKERARIETIAWHNRAEAAKGAGLIVNTTSLGMAGSAPLEIDLSGASPTAIAYDIVYTPLETGFLQEAKGAGLTPVTGLGMLIEQARAAFKIWFGIEPTVTNAQTSEVLDVLAARAKDS